MNWRQMVRAVQDMFSSGDRKKRDGKRKPKKLEEGKPHTDPDDNRQKTHVKIREKVDVSVEHVESTCRTSFPSDLDDDVFTRPQIQQGSRNSVKMASDENRHQGIGSDRRASKSLSAKTRSIPSAFRLSGSHRTSIRVRSPSDSLSLSESHLNTGGSSGTSDCVSIVGQRFFSSDMETPEPSPGPEQTISPQRCRGHYTNKSNIKVKYTKVYGDEDDAYKNDSVPRGLFFMCNFSVFKDNKYSKRLGSEQDYENMMSLFQQMGYGDRGHKKKYCHTGYITKKHFMERLQAFSCDQKHKMLCSCVIILMSHGSGPKTFVTSDNQEVDLMEVYSIFDNINCQHLKGKPKIFILQFCRTVSQSVARPLENQVVVDEDRLRKVVREEVYKILSSQNPQPLNLQGPTDVQAFEELTRKSSLASLSSAIEATGAVAAERSEHFHVSQQVEFSDYQSDTRNLPQMPQEGVQRYSDMYSIFSTSPGELSHRDKRKGSLLIQAICHVFAENAYHDEIDTLVRKVSTYMTKTLQKDDPVTVPRQTCERTNNGLDKLFFFNPHEMPTCRHVTI